MKILDLANQRFGSLKAIKSTDKRNKGSVIWLCQCDCGDLCFYSSKELKESKAKSCGCNKPLYIKDLTGQVFGKLEVLQITEKREGRSVVWECRCHGCNGIVEISSRALLVNNIKSCGCRGIHTESAIHWILYSYKRQAKQREISWGLTNDQTKKLFKSNCYYCGAEPHNRKKYKTISSVFVYNGIDRVDNDKGYTSTNTVSCCKRCNMAKKTLSLEEFENLIRSVYNHYILDKKRARLTV